MHIHNPISYIAICNVLHVIVCRSIKVQLCTCMDLESIPQIYTHYYNITSIKNNCLKLKNEVGMAVLKSKQTRVVASYIEIISTYV